jgi:hypothetical protein
MRVNVAIESINKVGVSMRGIGQGWMPLEHLISLLVSYCRITRPPCCATCLSEMKGGWQRLGLPVLVKGSGYACASLYLSGYLDSLSMQGQFANSTVTAS